MPQNRPLRERGPLIWRSGAGAWSGGGGRLGGFLCEAEGVRGTAPRRPPRWPACGLPDTAVRGFEKILLAIAWEASNIFPCLLKVLQIAGWSSLVARRAHNPEVVGSNPAPATINSKPWLRPGLFVCRVGKVVLRTSCIRFRRRFCGFWRFG